MTHSHSDRRVSSRNLVFLFCILQFDVITYFQSLEKRRRELARALDDNESLIEAALTRGRSDKELKLEADIDKLARVRNNENILSS